MKKAIFFACPCLKERGEIIHNRDFAFGDAPPVSIFFFSSLAPRKLNIFQNSSAKISSAKEIFRSFPQHFFRFFPMASSFLVVLFPSEQWRCAIRGDELRRRAGAGLLLTECRLRFWEAWKGRTHQPWSRTFFFSIEFSAYQINALKWFAFFYFFSNLRG